MPSHGRENAARVPNLQRLSFFYSFRHQRSQGDFVSKGKNRCLSSFPRAEFCADVSQLHSNFITETFAEIMIKTLASCNFKVIRDILAWIFFPFAITYQSSTWLADLPLFKQLTSLAARKALDLNLASPRRHVFFITFQPVVYASQSRTRHDDFLSLYWNSWMFFAGLIKTVKLQYCIAQSGDIYVFFFPLSREKWLNQ